MQRFDVSPALHLVATPDLDYSLVLPRGHDYDIDYVYSRVYHVW